MNFNSLGYILLLPCAALGYRALTGRAKNVLLLVISYAFYMCWQPKYALLLLFITCLSYFAARAVDNTERAGARKLRLALFVIAGFMPLFIYKYFNFFCGLIVSAIASAGLKLSLGALDLALPIGISFFSFQAVGYVIDVYRKKTPVEKDPLTYALFISFFPQLSAGPIGRAPQLMPQFREHRNADWQDVHEGLILFAWGLFKKMVIADQLAIIVNAAFDSPASCSSLQLCIAAICFSVQIYCDFSGYSDMAIGSARFFGIHLMRNFDSPYLSRSVKDFWRRWHISLSSWFRDYLYFPLGGSRKGYWITLLNVMIVFTVSGLWHGAAMTFVVWGALNGLFQVIGTLLSKQRMKLRKLLHISEDAPLLVLLQTAGTFVLMTVAWTFFRANSLYDALFILKRIALGFIGRSPLPFELQSLSLCIPMIIVVIFSIVLLTYTSIRRETVSKKLLASIPLRTCVLFALAAAILIFGSYGGGYDPQDFVYFKF